MDNIVLATAAENGFTAAQVDLIRQTAAKDCTDTEVAMLLVTAQRAGLDPLARQIYMISRWDAKARRNIATPQTSIDGYRLIADRTGMYAPGREPTFTYAAEGELVSATAFVKKWVGGQWHEVAATAFWDEYVQATKDGKPSFMWAKMPHTMLAKCAEALALRRAFPANLSGLYTDDEMAQATDGADGADVVVEVSTSLACSDCDQTIEATDKATAAQMADWSQRKLGRALCADCAKAALEAADAPSPVEVEAMEIDAEQRLMSDAIAAGYPNAEAVTNALNRLEVQRIP